MVRLLAAKLSGNRLVTPFYRKSEERQLPVLQDPVDELRYGRRVLHEEVRAGHPVDAIQKEIPQSSWRNQLWQAEMVYGPGVAMRMRMERAMLKQFQRVPGLPSSFAGLDTVTGRDTTIDFDDVLNTPSESPEMPVMTVHERLEAKLGF